VRNIITLFCLLAGYLGCVRAASLEAHSQFVRVDPQGAIIAADKAAAGQAENIYDTGGSISLRGPRNGYASFHLIAKLAKPGPYSVDVQWADGNHTVQTDVFREWFHFTQSDKHYYPDALIPVRTPYESRLPEPDNRIEQQSAQAFWVDIWIPKSAKPGVYRGEAKLEADGQHISRPIRLEVLAAAVPDDPAVVVDHNSYGTSWIGSQFPEARRRAGDSFFESDALFSLIHAYHRIFYDNLGTFHELGYGHGGKVGPEFAPELEGSGRGKHIANWRLYDKHYGPLLDGTAFTGSRRGAHPIPYVYLPINPEWPASYLWWGEPGYETEFVNVVSEMERHFREKGWTHTIFEMFFNHKKRYKAFSWDGDESRFPKDDKYFLEYGRLLKKALPADTPVQFRFRSDSSWMMERQFKELAGVVNFWILGGSMLSWYKDAPQMLKGRGDIVWIYGGTPTVTEPTGAVTFAPFQTWMWGIDGFVRWLAVSPGNDPWFHFGGGATALVYPGERFGITAPIPSLRLKLQRNCVQDISLLDSFKGARPLRSLKTEAAQRYNGSTLDEWWPPRPAIANLPPYELTNSSIRDNTAPIRKLQDAVTAESWARVRAWILQLAAEGK
jgi:hypothetical protein